MGLFDDWKEKSKKLTDTAKNKTKEALGGDEGVDELKKKTMKRAADWAHKAKNASDRVSGEIDRHVRNLDDKVSDAFAGTNKKETDKKSENTVDNNTNKNKPNRPPEP